MIDNNTLRTMNTQKEQDHITKINELVMKIQKANDAHAWDLNCKLNDKTMELEGLEVQWDEKNVELQDREMDLLEQLSIKEDEYEALKKENETYEKRREKRLNETEILVEDLQEENKKLKEENEAFRLQDKYLQQRIELTWLEELKKPSPLDSERNGKNKFAKPINTPHAFCELNVHYQALKKDNDTLREVYKKVKHIYMTCDDLDALGKYLMK